MLLVRVIFFFALLYSLPSLATVEVGLGTTSVTSGRRVPSLAWGWVGSSWGASGFSTGVKNDYYYHSAYGISFFKHWRAGDLGGGQVRTGFGLGFFYAQREFQDTGSGDPLEESSDFTGGPAFQVNWNFVGPLYVELNAIYGLRKPLNNLLLSTQDIVSFAVGYSL